ncbi:hypothetical protein NPX13_g96 [Xylaria arbuscula]|uniref:Zn(2)-C6 fungal-type domain-containing protein n=1 Tax=Xylaria arbuscula TaxID=114810 RepID=A0A9W8NP39_9PEZI|nr:hypothetical protein NPX13_g96 [Xylaria arbuscula]
MQADIDDLPPLRERVSQACDTCKQRKVKCDGKAPCSYCKRRHRERTCRFSPSVRRRRPASETPTVTTNVSTPSNHTRPATPNATPAIPASTEVHLSPTLTRHSDVSAEEEAEVPRDARLICDALGRLVFIGDCAPLSLFQTVRQIVTTRVDPHAFSPETGRVSMLENVSSEGLVPDSLTGEPVIHQASVQRLVTTYLTVTSGLVDLFDNNTLIPEIQAWANQVQRSTDATSAVNYLVLAIGSQSEDEQCRHSPIVPIDDIIHASVVSDQRGVFILWFVAPLSYSRTNIKERRVTHKTPRVGIAARAAYATGLHRTEVNSRFGPEVHIRRDRLWKSIRVLDLYLSISMGRPPAASDSDCTVPYHSPSSSSEDDNSRSTTESYDLLNASVQILSLVEGIVQEVYSRRKISLQLTEGISRQLRDWSDRWLSALLLRTSKDDPQDARERTGACQVLSSYYLRRDARVATFSDVRALQTSAGKCCVTPSSCAGRD